MLVSKAYGADAGDIKELWKYCFGYPAEYVDSFFDRAVSSSFVMTGRDEENGALLTSAVISPYELSINGNNMPAGYISRLCSSPIHKNTENEKALIRETLLYMKAHGQVVALAVPESYRLFDETGFRLAYQYKEYNIDMTDIPSYVQSGNIEICKSRGIGEHELRAFFSIYNGFVSCKNGYTVRNEYMWRMILDDFQGNYSGYAALIYENGTPSGYILYIIRNGIFYVYELAFLNRRTYETAFAFIKSHSAQTPKAVIKTCADDLGYLNLCDRRDAVQVRPYAAVRICDVGRVLADTAAGFYGSFRLRVIDRLIEENNCVFSIDGKIAEKSLLEPDAAMDIGTLAQLYTGHLSVSDAVSLDLIEGSIPDGLFKKRNNYINMLL